MFVFFRALGVNFSGLKLLTLFVLLCSHLPLAWRAVRSIRERRLPKGVYLIGLSFVLYFDLEIAFEAFGGTYQNYFFPAFFKAPDLAMSYSFLAILLGPWIVLVGYWMAEAVLKEEQSARFRLQRAPLFYAFALVVCGITAAISALLIAFTGAIWSARYAISEALGPWIIFLYAPLGILAFYIHQRESFTWRGKIFTVLLAVLATVAESSMGERTMALLPLLMLFLFWGRTSLKRMVVAGTALLVLAAVLVPSFKNSDVDSSAVVNADFGRAPGLTQSIEQSSVIGSNLLPYPGSGYVYSLFLYVPRSIAPFKGYSTATVFTAKMASTNPVDTDWVLGISVLDEIILNFGLIALPFGLAAYGAAFAWLDSRTRYSFLRAPVALSAIWLCGYNLPALLQTFGSIALFGGLCHWLFTKRQVVLTATVQSSLKPSLWLYPRQPT